MNLQLAKEIYNSTWAIDNLSFSAYNNILQDHRNGVAFSVDVKSNNYSFVEVQDISSTGKNVPRGTIAVYNFDGVITKNGGSSHFGTKELAEQFEINDANPDIIGHLIVADSGGGSADAVKVMSKAIGNRTKPLVSLIDGHACSAMYWIVVGSDYIFANDGKDVVGSIGVMVEFRGYKANSELPDGSRIIRAYATPSSEKNIDFEEALNNFNVQMLIDDMLNPLAEDFLAHIKSNRPQIEDKYLKGNTYFAENVLGVFVDEIGEMSDAITKLRELSELNKSNTNINSTSAMNLSEFKAEHPDLHTQIVAETSETAIQTGIAQEKGRTDAILEWYDIDPEACITAIKDGTQADIAFINKMSAAKAKQVKQQNALSETTSAVGSKTEQAEIEKTAENPEASAEIDAINKKFGIA